MARIKIDKTKEESSSRLANLKEFLAYLENQKSEVKFKLDESDLKLKKVQERAEKLKFNFEVVVYLKQGQVEIPQLPVATDYKDAILVKKAVIEAENASVVEKGRHKVKTMEKISHHRTTLKTVKFKNQKLKLQITDAIERAKDVQLYRVTKQT